MKRTYLLAFVLVMLYVSVGNAQYPVMDSVADKIIQKYQTATCEQIWIAKSQKKPLTLQEQEAIQILKNDPQMRAAFIAKVAAPVANKMFDCGMIP